MTSKAVWRPPWPHRPPKWLLEANIHMHTRVVEVTEFNSEVICDLRGYFEGAMASEGIKMAVVGNMHIYTRAMKVAGFKSEVKLDL